MRQKRLLVVRIVGLLLILGLLSGMSTLAAPKQSTGEPTDPDGEPAGAEGGEPTDPESIGAEEFPTAATQDSWTFWISWPGLWIFS